MEPVRSDLAGEDGGAIATEHEETDDLLDRAFEEAIQNCATVPMVEPGDRQRKPRGAANDGIDEDIGGPSHGAGPRH